VNRHPGIAVAGLTSLAAGIIHGGAIGLHVEHPQLARIFIVVTLLQVGWGLTMLLAPGVVLIPAGVLINGAAVGGWLLTRIGGISWIDGLEVAESPQWADSICAGLGAIAASTALAAVLIGSRPLPSVRLTYPAMACAALVVPAMWTGSTHVHDHSTALAANGVVDESQPHDHSDEAVVEVSNIDGSDTVTTDAHPHLADWPRAYDPAVGIDIGGVEGVSAEQESRARALIESTLDELPRWANYDDAVAQGWVSIGDESTGYEHLVNRRLIVDDKFLDPTAPESLVYRAEGSKRTLVSAMFMANVGVAIDDPTLTDFAGPLMQWHVHDNLCFRNNAQGRSVVAGVLNAEGKCPAGSALGGIGISMVHVWITAHPCGPFAALEGEGAGRANVSDAERKDLCEHDHATMSSGSGASGASTTPETTPAPTTTAPSYKDNGSARISLAGFPGVSADQQARAEELVYRTRTVLPKFATTDIAIANGYSSIQDSSTGVEHYVNWSYINDEHELNPDYPESLVFQVGPNGQRTLVSAMYMLGDSYTLDSVPDIGGSLTQWHIHNNLCYSQDPFVNGSTRVVGVTSENGPCSFGIKLNPNPMIHVWIKPHPCGPFAALEGVGAGQIKPGEERLCDDVHSHG
jgi:phage tail protein X